MGSRATLDLGKLEIKWSQSLVPSLPSINKTWAIVIKNNEKPDA